MVGKTFSRWVTKNIKFKVEVLAETPTHVYIKCLEPTDESGTRKHPCINVPKDWFFNKYTEDGKNENN